MTIDLDSLEKLADEAAPGPYTYEVIPENRDTTGIRILSQGLMWEASSGTFYPTEVVGGTCCCCGTVGVNFEKDAAFIAAANPATIKALIAELKEARGLLAEAKSYFAPDQDAVAMLVRVDAFLARNGKSDLQKMQNSARNGKGERIVQAMESES